MEDLALRLSKAIGEFVDRWVETNSPPVRTPVMVRISVMCFPLPLTGEGTEPKRRQRKPAKKRSAAERPLTETEWGVLKCIPYPPRLRKILEFFVERNNREASKAEMIAAGVIPNQSFQFASFNSFSKMHGSNCVIKHATISHIPEEPSTFRIFPLVQKNQ